ncbi:hypothetical protein [Methylobacterium sp. ID0610]|uniref:hypothetical protein n=1 Tax=Methylobacterium carpenticola TaxID=3344827 RepID=UPI0036C671F8
MFVLTRAGLARTSLAVATAALLGGCISNPLGQTGGVLPANDVGPPPSLRSELRAPARGTAPADADPDQVVANAPTRRLNVPANSRAGGATADNQPRRIRREDLEDYSPSRGGGGGSLGPSIGSGGSVGVGGRF